MLFLTANGVVTKTNKENSRGVLCLSAPAKRGRGTAPRSGVVEGARTVKPRKSPGVALASTIVVNLTTIMNLQI
jgi:hypothetical protein